MAVQVQFENHPGGECARQRKHTTIRSSLRSDRIVKTALVAASVFLAGCSSPCMPHHVVQSHPGPNTGTFLAGLDVELDDGHVYRGLFHYAQSTGDDVELCVVESKIDGRAHYSIRGVHGGPIDVDRVK